MADVNVFAYQGGDAANTKAASANSKTKTKDEDIVPEVDNNLQDGPIFKRSCTDCLCCPLFILFCAGMCWALIYGVSNGDPYKLITLYDYDGNGCGYTSAVKNYPYIYWPTISYTTSITEVSYRDVCVKKCPTISNSLTSSDCYTNSIVTSCTSGTSYDTVLYLGKFCIPDTSSVSSSSTYTKFKDAIMNDYGGNYITTYMADVYYCWWVFIVAACVAYVLGFVYMLLIKCCAKIMIWFTIFSGFFALLACGLYLYFTSFNYSSTDSTRSYMQYGAYSLFGCCLVYLLIVLCCCNRLRLGIAIMQTTADYINQTKRVFLVPIFFFVIVMIFYAYWIISAIYIWSVGTVKIHSTTPFASISWSSTTRYVFLYDLFGLFWVNAFMIGCCQFILAVAAATWYFSHSADSGGSAMIFRGFKWILRYHLGSIAFGSLVIAICEFIKFMFEYYRKKMTGRIFQNPVGKCLLWTTSYCLNCLNRVVKYISKMAYIQIALTSSNFCMSAWKAFILILGNAGRFAVATILGAIFIFVGKVLIVCSTVIVCYIIITQTSSINSKISGPYFPCLLFAVISYCVAAVFLSIFGFSMDVILQSFLVDETLAGEGSYGAHRPRTLDAFAKQPPSKGGKKCCCC